MDNGGKFIGFKTNSSLLNCCNGILMDSSAFAGSFDYESVVQQELSEKALRNDLILLNRYWY